MSERSLFEVFGIELEYMIVDKTTLDIKPIADELIRAASGQVANDVQRGEMEWSNELVLHLIEFKTAQPVADFTGLAAKFEQQVAEAGSLLRRLGGRLMPSGMHPWMEPKKQVKLWPYEYADVYQAYHRIFDCKVHGWGNLQSVHLNLPFANDEEFGRLHAAIRVLLPILPALSASSPFQEGVLTGLFDNRLAQYRDHMRAVPSAVGDVIPEPIFSKADYLTLLDTIYRDFEPHDPEGLLKYEWCNARGANARFERNTIEIRVLDMQENPRADLALCALVIEVLKALVAERWCSFETQKSWAVKPLSDIFLRTIRDGDDAIISDASFLKLFGWQEPFCRAADLWSFLGDELKTEWQSLPPEIASHVAFVLEHGTLSRRLMEQAKSHPDRWVLSAVYKKLCDGLVNNTAFK